MTTLTALYDDVLSRIRLSATGLSGSAVTTRYEWSPDAITWGTVRGGAVVPVLSNSTNLDHYEFSPGVVNRYRVIELDSGGAALATTTIATGAPMSNVWIKVPAAPYANRKVVLTGWSELTRETRSGVFAVSGRRDQVVVSDLHTGRRVTVNLRGVNDTETAALDLVLSLGLPILLHVPPSCPLPSLHAAVGNYAWDRPAPRSHVGRFRVALTEVAAPDVSLAAPTVTYAALTRLYATYTELTVAHATYATIPLLSGAAVDALAGA